MRLTTASALVAGIAVARAQSLNDGCTRNTWSFNREQRSPCTLWQDLTALCSSSASSVARFHFIAEEYVPPATDIPCACNVVAFNLASACALCHESFDSKDLIPESEWKGSCERYNDTGVPRTYAEPAQALVLPGWTALPERGGVFQAAVARQLALAEGIVEITLPTTSSSTQTSSAASSPSASGAATGHGPPIGAIAGGVVAGVVGLAAAVLLALWLHKRSTARNRTAFVTPRDPPQEKQFGLPSDIKVQHFVPPPASLSSAGASFDNLPSPLPAGAGLGAHPFAANYAVQRNMASASADHSGGPTRSYTSSSSNYDALAGHSIMPMFDTSSITAEPQSISAASHPYANPVVQDGYTRTTPETPSPYGARMAPWAALAASQMGSASQSQLPPPQSLTRPLPPLKVPQPVRHSSTSTATDLDLSSASWGSAAPLISGNGAGTHSTSGHGHATGIGRHSSIDEVFGVNGGAVSGAGTFGRSRPLPQRPPSSSWDREP